MSSRKINLDVNYIIHEYTVTKRTIQDIARELGVSRSVISHRLINGGVTIRTMSEASFLSATRQTPKQRLDRVKNAHDAIRGTHNTRETKVKRAKTVEYNCTIDSGLESMVFESMLDRGIRMNPQTAIDIYNVDFTIDSSIVVEIFGGNWHFYGRHRARHTERYKKIIDSGYTVIILHITNPYPFTNAVADDMAAYIKRLSRDKSIIGKNRMVWGTFDRVTTFGRDSVDETLIVPPKHFRNRIT